MIRLFAAIIKLVGLFRRGGYDERDIIPDAENQYNYPGSWSDFFLHVYTDDFPEYRTECERRNDKHAVYRLYDGDRLIHVSEVVSQNSKPKGDIKNECAERGIPYLRYYHDHYGWWNLRSYIVQRTKASFTGLL